MVVAPSWLGDSWPHFFKTDPVSAVVLCCMGVLWLDVALGMPGVELLNRRLNRFDLQREITIAPSGVTIARGRKIWNKRWTDFACYYETAALYVLQTRGMEFWTIPKRAFEPGIQEIFHEVLESNLPRKGKSAKDNPKSTS